MFQRLSGTFTKGPPRPSEGFHALARRAPKASPVFTWASRVLPRACAPVGGFQGRCKTAGGLPTAFRNDAPVSEGQGFPIHHRERRGTPHCPRRSLEFPARVWPLCTGLSGSRARRLKLRSTSTGSERDKQHPSAKRLDVCIPQRGSVGIDCSRTAPERIRCRRALEPQRTATTATSSHGSSSLTLSSSSSSCRQDLIHVTPLADPAHALELQAPRRVRAAGSAKHAVA